MSEPNIQTTGRTVTAELVFCIHPAEHIRPGPTIPRVYGSGQTQVCGVCRAWRPAWFQHADWRSGDTLEAAMQEDDGR